MNNEKEFSSEYLTVTEAAELLRRSERDVRTLLTKDLLQGNNPTGRKWIIPREGVNKFLGKPSNKGGGDRDLGPHQRELFYFGQRLRDRIMVPQPVEVVSLAAEDMPIGMWRGQSVSLDADSPRDMEEESVERDWSFGLYDAREHPLFPFLEQHLQNTGSLSNLLEVREPSPIASYRLACQLAYKEIATQIQLSLPIMSQEDIQMMTYSLLSDGFYHVTGSKGLLFTYRREQFSDKEGTVHWSMAMGAWRVGSGDSPDALNPIEYIHKKLNLEMRASVALQRVGETWEAARKMAESFRNGLIPDARLRKLVQDGLCELCVLIR